jgi:class 3 adenylate cyclase
LSETVHLAGILIRFHQPVRQHDLRCAAAPDDARQTAFIYAMAPNAADLTILFSDVRGFTGISEALEPGELREYVHAYLTDMSGIIRSKYRGTLDK